MPKPTPAQVELIRAYGGEQRSGRRVGNATLRSCDRNGWIEPTEQWPYHRTTKLGAEAAGMEYDPLFARLIAVGDRVCGRDVTLQHEVEGVVTAIHYPRGLGYFQQEPNDRPARGRRYSIDTGEMTTIVESAHRIGPASPAEGSVNARTGTHPGELGDV